MTTQLIDYSSARPSPAGLVRAGIRGVGRYVGALGSISKQLGATEAAALRAAGLDIFLLVEEAADSAMGGTAVGARHARSAVDMAHGLGAPPTTALYFAVDFDVTAAQWPTVASYLNGAASGAGAARVGIYGGRNAVLWARRDRVASWFFQTYAWSDPDHDGITDWVPGNHIEQYHNGQTVPGTVGDVDLCRTDVDDYGQWRVKAGPSPTTKRDGLMFGVKEESSAAIWLSTGGRRRGGFTWPQYLTMCVGGLITRPTPGTATIAGQTVTCKVDSSGWVLVVPDGSLSAYAGPIDTDSTGGGAVLVPHTHEIPAIPAEPSGPAIGT